MQIRFCGMCGEPARSISAVFLPADRRTVETRWCPQCGSLGLRERNPDKTLYETWELPQIQKELTDSDITALLRPL